MHHATLASLQAPLIALAGVLLARALVDGGFELSGRWGATRIMSELRGRLVRRLLLESPELRPNAGRTGELASTAVQGVDALEAYFAGYLPQLVLAAVVPMAVIGWVITLDPITAGILALTVPLLVLFMVLIGKGARAQAAATLAGARAARRALPRCRTRTGDSARILSRGRTGADARRRRRALPRRDDGDAANRLPVGVRARAVRDDRHRAGRSDDRRAARVRRARPAGWAYRAAARARDVRPAAPGWPAVPREH